MGHHGNESFRLSQGNRKGQRRDGAIELLANGLRDTQRHTPDVFGPVAEADIQRAATLVADLWGL
jgi:hypothetical protein